MKTLQIGSVAFPAGQCTSPQLHSCHRVFDQDGHQDTSSPPYRQDLALCNFCFFPKLRGYRYETIEEMEKAVTQVIDTLSQEDFHGALQKLLGRYKCIAAGRDYFEGDKSFMCVLSIKVHNEKNLETYRMCIVQLISLSSSCSITCLILLQGRGIYPPILLSFNCTLWSAGTTKYTTRQFIIIILIL